MKTSVYNIQPKPLLKSSRNTCVTKLFATTNVVLNLYFRTRPCVKPLTWNGLVCRLVFALGQKATRQWHIVRGKGIKEYSSFYYLVLYPSLPHYHSPPVHGSTADSLPTQETPLGHNWPPSKLETIRKEFCLCKGRSGEIDTKHQKRNITSLLDEYPSKFQDFCCLPEYTRSLRLEEAVGGLELSGWSAVNEPPLETKKTTRFIRLKCGGACRLRFCKQLTSKIW